MLFRSFILQRMGICDYFVELLTACDVLILEHVSTPIIVSSLAVLYWFHTYSARSYVFLFSDVV